MNIKTKFIVIILVIFVFLVVGIWGVTLNFIDNTLIRHVTNRVKNNISSAWLIHKNKLHSLQNLAQFLSEEIDMPPRSKAELTERLISFKNKYNLDILNVIDSEGKVLIRTNFPYQVGDNLLEDPLVRQTLFTGKPVAGTILLTSERLNLEGNFLFEKCRQNGGEVKGMLLAAGIPLLSEGKSRGVIQVGILLNGVTHVVDEIRDSVFANEWYKGKPLGTATIFMQDLRISTNVMRDKSNRATGTRVSQEVIDQVLNKGISWTGRAWVVDAWYISQYDPIRDPNGNVIGMFYIGELEQKYKDIRADMLVRYLFIILIAMALTFLFILIGVNRMILNPIHELAESMKKIEAGDLTHRTEILSQDEVGRLSHALNSMADQIEKQNREIQRKKEELELVNDEIRSTNHNYMEMLGFVSHQLKTPLASTVMSIYTVKDGYLGDLNESQKKSLDAAARTLDHFGNMVRNYLDLSRLEKGELKLQKNTMEFNSEVNIPVLESQEREINSKNMRVENAVPKGLKFKGDHNLLRIVWDNFLSNAVKYGKSGGTIQLKAEMNFSRVIFSVTNEGAGVPREKIPDLFKKFSRLDEGPETRKLGTGLGLYICRTIVQQHGGETFVESEEGKWAKFGFYLPVDKKEEE